MFNHVLVPLDGSELSEKALITARQMLAEEGHLTLVSVIDLPHMSRSWIQERPTDSEYQREDELSTARKNVQTYLSGVVALQHLPPTLTVSFKICAGDPAAIITALARALQVDAIVMSTHGRSGISRWVFGSVTQKVLGLATRPVVVVPGHVSVADQTHTSQVVPSPSL